MSDKDQSRFDVPDDPEALVPCHADGTPLTKEELEARRKAREKKNEQS